MKTVMTKLAVFLTLVLLIAACAPQPAAPVAEAPAAEAPAAPAAEAPAAPAAEAPAALPDTIQIAIVDSFTGGHAAYGTGSLDGYELARKYRPEVLGKKVVFKTYDVKSDKAEASLAASRAISDGAIAILGTASSGFSMAVNEVAVKEMIPVISNISTNPLVTQDKPNAFRTCFIDPYQGWALAKLAVEEMKAKTAVLLVDISTDYPVGIANFFRSSWNDMTGEPTSLLGYYSIMQGDKDFSAQLTAIKALNPDVIVAPDDYAEVGLIIRQAREMGLTQPILSADGCDLPEIADIAGDAINTGLIFTTHWHEAAYDTEVAKNFGKYFEEEYGRKPDMMAALAWDSYNVLLDAIEKTNTVEKMALIKALEETDYTGVSGHITFDKDHNANKNVVVLTFKNGERELLNIIQAD